LFILLSSLFFGGKGLRKGVFFFSLFFNSFSPSLWGWGDKEGVINSLLPSLSSLLFLSLSFMERKNN